MRERERDVRTRFNGELRSYKYNIRMLALGSGKGQLN
jgi:hypothetical protein